MANRKRNKRIVLQVTDEEKKLIEERRDYFGFRDTASYLRKTAIDVTVINVNTDGLLVLSKQVSMIGNNINQIARVYNQEHNLRQSDVDRLLAYQEELVSLVNRMYDDMTTLKNQTEVDV